MPSRIPTSKEFQERFWSKVKKADGDACWEWQASLSVRGGYGQLTAGRGNLLKAHRVVYEVTKGAPAPGLLICHTCNNPRCCNPDHLYAGTVADNWRDAKRAGAAHKFAVLHGEACPASKLTEVEALRVLSSEERGADLARELGVTPSAISRIRKGKSWLMIQ